MKELKISVFNVVGDRICMEPNEGQKIFEIIKIGLSEKKKIVLSFKNVTQLTTAFLNNAIGKLYSIYSEKEIKDCIKIEDITHSGAISLKKVIEVAKAQYNDPDALRRSINEIMGD